MSAPPKCPQCQRPLMWGIVKLRILCGARYLLLADGDWRRAEYQGFAAKFWRV